MLKLFFASPSPYARKVRVLIAEKGPTPSIEMIVRAPFEKPADLVALNPLSKIPTLVTDDGQILFDSPVIAEYLDGLGGAEINPSRRARTMGCPAASSPRRRHSRRRSVDLAGRPAP